MSGGIPPTLAGNPDRLRWNQKYEQSVLNGVFNFAPGSWLPDLLEADPPEGPVLELAGGRSGTALALAESDRHVTVVDVSDVALREVADEGARRGLTGRLTLTHADLLTWVPERRHYALVMCRYFWDPGVFHKACGAVADGGVLAWEAPVANDRHSSHVREQWRPKPGEPASLLSPEFALLRQDDIAADSKVSRLMIARKSC